MNPERMFKRAVLGSAVFVASVLVVDGLAQPDDQPSTPVPRVADSATYSHEDLQSDADMTQLMSDVDGTGAAVHRGDAQLQRSNDPAYVRSLEQHQAEIDRMLARPGR